MVFVHSEKFFSNSVHERLRLCDFLKIKEEETLTSERINPSPATKRVPKDVLNKLGKHCALLIEAVMARCQDLKVKEFKRTTQQWL